MCAEVDGIDLADTCCMRSNDSANYYYWNNVLKASSGFEDVANFNWELLGCLALAWVICYICVFKGVESSGKVCERTLGTFAELFLDSVQLFNHIFSISRLTAK